MHLITRPSLLNHILFICYDKMVNYSATSNQLSVRKFEPIRTEKHLTLHLDFVEVDPKRDIQKAIKVLRESLDVVHRIEEEVLRGLTNKGLLESARDYKRTVFGEMIEEVAPILYFIQKEQEQ